MKKSTLFFLFLILYAYANAGEPQMLTVKGRLKSTVIVQDGNGNIVSVTRTCKGSRGVCFTVETEIVDETIQHYCRSIGYNSTVSDTNEVVIDQTVSDQDELVVSDSYLFQSPSKIRLSKVFRNVSDGRVISAINNALLSEEEKELVEIIYNLEDFNAFN